MISSALLLQVVGRLGRGEHGGRGDDAGAAARHARRAGGAVVGPRAPARAHAAAAPL